VSDQPATPTVREVHVLNLGLGVQSTTLYLLGCPTPEQPVPELHFDYAVFADTQGEPKRVYRHLEWLRTQGGPPILTHTIGDLKADLVAGRNSAGHGKKGEKGEKDGGRFASIPAFTAPHHVARGKDYDPLKEAGRVRRQCTREYKTDVVERVIKRMILELKPKQRVPKSVKVFQYIGISIDERSRAVRIIERFKDSAKWSTPVFPLIDKGWTRGGCKRFLEQRAPHKVGKSACYFCPYQDDQTWADMKANDPESWAGAVEVDRALRPQGTVCSRGMNDALYLHRQCIPLEMVDLSNPKPPKLDNFSLFDCLGMCGN
jgi:hypothetical protein